MVFVLAIEPALMRMYAAQDPGLMQKYARIMPDRSERLSGLPTCLQA